MRQEYGFLPHSTENLKIVRNYKLVVSKRFTFLQNPALAVRSSRACVPCRGCVSIPAVRRAAYPIILLLVVSFGTLFFRLGSLPLSGADEPRYARIAREMADGGRWVTPLLEGKPWLEKPPLYYWLTIPLYSLPGFSAEAAARLAPALCALTVTLAIYSLGAVLWSRKAGFFGAIILLTSLGMAGFGRSASTDMPFTCFFTLAMAILASGRRVGLAYVFLGLAVLGKGPVAVILAAGILLVAWYFDDRGGLFGRLHVVSGSIITAAVSIPWFWLAFRENGYAFLSTFFINHNLARYVTGIHHHAQPFYYYLPVLIALLFPWSGWLPVLLRGLTVKGIRDWRAWDPDMVFLAAWFAVPMVFFSLSQAKLAGYILPSLPPLALLLGIAVARAIDSGRSLRPAAAVHLALSALLAVAAPVAFSREYGGAWQTGLMISAAVLLPALFSFGFALKGKGIPAFAATAIQGLLLVAAVAQFAFPVLGAYHSTREIAQMTLEARRPAEPLVTYRFFHHSLHYYTGYRVAGKLDAPEELLQLAAERGTVLVVTNEQGEREIRRIGGLSSAALGRQGKFRLLRVSFGSAAAALFRCRTDSLDETKGYLNV